MICILFLFAISFLNSFVESDINYNFKFNFKKNNNEFILNLNQSSQIKIIPSIFNEIPSQRPETYHFTLGKRFSGKIFKNFNKTKIYILYYE